MKIKTSENKNCTIISIYGNVLQENVTLFRNRLDELIDSGISKIIINMAGTSYISSLCLAIFIETKNKLIVLNGDIKLAFVNSVIQNLFEITNLDRKIEIYDSLEQALHAFNQE
jgi:anti-anti-sigma factor